MTNTTPNDAVNHPSHYTQYPVEVIELTRHMSFTRGNAVKYIARAGFKGGPEKEIEDLEKAEWYIKDTIAEAKKKLADQKAAEAEAEKPFTKGLWDNNSDTTNFGRDTVVSHPAVLLEITKTATTGNLG
jgi:hypothetical protein